MIPSTFLTLRGGAVEWLTRPPACPHKSAPAVGGCRGLKALSLCAATHSGQVIQIGMRRVLVVGILNTGADLVYPFIPMALAFPPLN